MHESALITAGNGAIKQLTPDLLAICLCIGEISMVIYLIVYNKHPKFSKKKLHILLVSHFFLCHIYFVWIKSDSCKVICMGKDIWLFVHNYPF